MKEKRFTPGPWMVLPEEVDRPYIRIRGTKPGGRYKIANVITPIYENVHEREAKETRANSQLIAAAPELLEALIQLKAHVEDRYWGEQSLFDLSGHPMKLAHDSIAKALGKE